MKINANFNLFAGVHFNPSKYIESPAYGVSRFMLDRIGEEKARATTIVKYTPDSKFPEHTHIGGEEFLVLEGTFKDQSGEYPAGTYVRNPIGSSHAPWVDGDGCTILVKLLQMSETSTSDEQESTLHIHVEEQKQKRGKATEFGVSLDMYSNKATGEAVQMCWLNPNQDFLATTEGGGEELFVTDGSLEVCDNTNSNNVVYGKWGWLRFPPGAQQQQQRTSLKSGADGAIVYRKTGHLSEKALSMEKIKTHEL